jgi:hypothetical protein
MRPLKGSIQTVITREGRRGKYPGAAAPSNGRRYRGSKNRSKIGGTFRYIIICLEFRGERMTCMKGGRWEGKERKGKEIEVLIMPERSLHR